MAIAGAPSLAHASTLIRYKPMWIDIPIVTGVALLLSNLHHEVVHDWSIGPVFFDSVHYHIPRALLWSWHGNLKPWRAQVWQQIASPYGGAATLLPLVFFGCGWLGGAWTSAVFALGSAAAVFVIGKSFGFTGRSALIASLAFLSFPAIGLRLSDVSTDIAATFPVVAAVALFRTAPTLPEGVFTFGALVGLGAATKQYAAFPAILLGLALAAPHLRAIIADIRILRAGIMGAFIAAVFVLLSLLPIYEAFGDFIGGTQGLQLSTLRASYYELFRPTAFTLIDWAAEPLSVLSDQYRDKLYYALRVDKLCELLPAHPLACLPHFDQEHSRAGIVPLLALPWLILGVKRGYRRIIAALFALLCFAQFSPLAINPVGGSRFAIVPLAAFALLWGARAQTMPLVVSLVVLCSLWVDHEYIKGRGQLALIPHYSATIEPYGDVAALVKERTLFLLPRSLSTDAFVAGRLAQTRFEYVSCPLDGDWIKLFQELKQKSPWFMFSVNEPKVTPGPGFESRLGRPCSVITIEELKGWLDAAGWKFMLLSAANHELWTTK